MNIKIKVLCHVLAFVFLMDTFTTKAQSPITDTLKFTIELAEQQFASNSLQLLASKFDVDIAKSNILQAKQWYNPNISYAQHLYDSQTKKYLDNSGATGNVDGQLNQLISIAGKHSNTVKLAKLNAERSQLLFNEVVRSLKYELYSNYADLLADQQKVELYEFEDNNLSLLIKAEEQELALGAISGNEVVRLKTERNNLRNEELSITEDLFEAQKNLKQLLNYPCTTYLIATNIAAPSTALPPYSQVLSLSEQNRPDLLLAKNETEYELQILKLQKSSAVPDITLSTSYTRRSSYVPNYYGIGASMELCIFNRNQGQIKAARFQVEQAKVLDTLQINEVRNEVANAYILLLKIKSRIDLIDLKNYSDIEQLVINAVKNYRKRNIGLLEFLDQLRTYKDAKFGMIDLNSDYYKEIQNLNYTAGTTILK